MNKIALMFPGQGCQFVGMGYDIYKKYPSAKSILDQADEMLNFSITSLMFNGPSDDLVQTQIAQPAILAQSIACFTVLKELGLINPTHIFGHSLGEFTALVAAEVLSFAQAIKLVHYRGLVMAEAMQNDSGAMAAIIGFDNEVINLICQELSQNDSNQVVSIANYNGPGQTVIAGNTNLVKKALTVLADQGAKKTIMLNVSAPFHCSLMSSAQEKLKNYLKEITFQNAKIPVISNVTATESTCSSIIKENIIKQVTAPVRFTQMASLALSKGNNCYLEIGPKKVLSSIIKRIDKTVKILAVYDEQSIANTSKSLKSLAIGSAV